MVDLLDVPALETERLRLVIPTEEMAAPLAELLRRNRRHFAAASPRVDREPTPESCLEQIRVGRAEAAAGRALHLLLIARDDPSGAPIGSVSFTQIVRGAFLATYLGYRIDERHQGRGLMTEALRCAIRYAFEQVGLHRIMAAYVPTHERSGRLLRRLGFTVEGYARDYLFLDGAWRDHLCYALTTEDVPSGLSSRWRAVSS